MQDKEMQDKRDAGQDGCRTGGCRIRGGWGGREVWEGGGVERWGR